MDFVISVRMQQKQLHLEQLLSFERFRVYCTEALSKWRKPQENAWTFVGGYTVCNEIHEIGYSTLEKWRK